MERRFRNTPRRTRAMLWAWQAPHARDWAYLALMLVLYTSFAALVMWSLF